MRASFSKTEYAGIALMVVGLASGSVSRMAGDRTRARATAELQQGLGVEAAAELSTRLAQVSSRLSSALTLYSVEGMGFWTFLWGVAVFVVARRRRENLTCRTSEDAMGAEHLD